MVYGPSGNAAIPTVLILPSEDTLQPSRQKQNPRATCNKARLTAPDHAAMPVSITPDPTSLRSLLHHSP